MDLFKLKNGLNYNSLGLLIGTDGSKARRNFEKYLTVLERTLERKKVMLLRNFENLEEFKRYLGADKEIILDASEQATQRPKKQEEQKGFYSEKKRNTYKELIICNKKRQNSYVSKPYRGKEHDYDLLEHEFPPAVPWFAHLTVRLDLGFQGVADLKPCESVYILIKRKRVAKRLSNELSAEQNEHNKELGKERIYVEHSVGGMKRYRILEHRNRIKSRKVLDQVIGVCAGLWNLLLNS